MYHNHTLAEQHVEALRAEAAYQRQVRLAVGPRRLSIYQIIPLLARIQAVRVHMLRQQDSGQPVNSRATTTQYAVKGTNGSEWFYRQPVDVRKNRIDAKVHKTVS